MRRLSDQRGQTAAEYMGMLLLVATVVFALLFAGLAGQIGDGAQRAICLILGGTDCAEAEQADSNAPRGPCVLAAANQKFSVNGSFNVRLARIELEGGVEYLREKRSDGTVAVTVKLGTGGAVGAALARKLGSVGIDPRITGAQQGGMTFVLPSDAAANEFADQLEETTKAIAAGPLVSRIAGWEVDIDVPQVESVYYQTGPGASVAAEADSGTGYGEGSIDVQTALGVRRDLTTGTPDSGDTTIYYAVDGTGGGEAGSLIGGAAGVNVNGSWQIAVTLDARGNPKTLSLIGAGGVEGTLGLSGKEKNLQAVVEQLESVELSANQGEGRRIEVQADLDLTDPELRASALSLLQGRNPDTAQAVSRADAAQGLWDAMVENATVNYRTYDTTSSRGEASLELPVGPGAGGAYESTDNELTGASYLEPGQGFVPWEACRRPS